MHEDYEDTDVVAYASGVCYWIPPVNFHTTCELDYKYWPWDEQHCNIIMGSWTKSGSELDVVLGNQLNVRTNPLQLDLQFALNYSLIKVRRVFEKLCP